MKTVWQRDRLDFGKQRLCIRLHVSLAGFALIATSALEPQLIVTDAHQPSLSSLRRTSPTSPRQRPVGPRWISPQKQAPGRRCEWRQVLSDAGTQAGGANARLSEADVPLLLGHRVRSDAFEQVPVIRSV